MGVFSLIIGGIYSKVDGSVQPWRYYDGNGAGPLPTDPVANDANTILALQTCEALGPLAKYLWSSAGAAQTINFYVSPDTTFLLDGVPTDRLNTPPGFIITDFSIDFTGAGGVAPGESTITLKQGPLLSVSLAPTIDAIAAENCGIGGTRSYTIPTRGPLANFSVLNDPFGFQIVNNTGANLFAFANYITLTGNYIIDTNQFTVTPTSGLYAGSEITITDSEKRLRGVTGGFQQTSIDGYTVRTPIIIGPRSFDGRTLIIRLPRGVTTGDILILVFEGTSFSGEESVAVLTAAISDAQGAYKLTVGKRHDTFYDRTDPLDVEELDVAIPTPFGRTGFF